MPNSAKTLEIQPLTIAIRVSKKEVEMDVARLHLRAAFIPRTVYTGELA